MMIHELKTWDEPFQALRLFKKPYEIRKFDRDYKIGDILILRHWDRNMLVFTGPFIVAEVLSITMPGQWYLPNDICVMGIKITESSSGYPELQRVRKELCEC